MISTRSLYRPTLTQRLLSVVASHRERGGLYFYLHTIYSTGDLSVTELHVAISDTRLNNRILKLIQHLFNNTMTNTAVTYTYWLNSLNS